MSDFDRIPSVDQINTLYRHVREVLVVAQAVPPSLQSTLDKMTLMGAIYSMEWITTAPPFYTPAPPPCQGGVSMTKAWIPGMSNVLEHIRDVAATILARWGLTRVADWRPYPDRDPIPEFPLVIENHELQVLSGASGVLDAALQSVLNSSPISPAREQQILTVGEELGTWQLDRQVQETLQSVGHRLTTSKLLYEMERRRIPVDESSLKKRLAAMVKANRLTNDPKARPRGYGLPDWTSSAGS
jgi:hypothetical protein